MNSSLIVKFLAEYSKLKEICLRNPGELVRIAAGDSHFIAFCRSIYEISSEIRDAEVRLSQAYTGPVDPKFIEAWREWIEEFEDEVFHLLLKYSEMSESGVRMSVATEEIVKWELADAFALELAADFSFLDFAINYLQPNLLQLKCSIYLEASVESEENRDLLDFMSILKDKIGFDVQKSARRRKLLPFTMIPRALNEKLSVSHRVNLLRILEDAQRAFVFGADNAAIALLRSVLERTLRNHYMAQGVRLDELIFDVRDRLPVDLRFERLDSIRKIANSILHGSPGDRDYWKYKNEKNIEIEIVFMFDSVRLLIEGIR